MHLDGAVRCNVKSDMKNKLSSKLYPTRMSYCEYVEPTIMLYVGLNERKKKALSKYHVYFFQKYVLFKQLPKNINNFTHIVNFLWLNRKSTCGYINKRKLSVEMEILHQQVSI